VFKEKNELTYYKLVILCKNDLRKNIQITADCSSRGDRGYS